MSSVLYSPYISEHYLNWMTEHDAEARKVTYGKNRSTKNETTKNDLS